jgi:hypothetical protein
VRHQRVLADTLFATPANVAHELLDELIEAFAGWGYDAFDRPWQNG